jgi:sodium pump decarboxylase gamma subunit
MVAGMGVVGVFLMLLVLLMHGTGLVFQKYSAFFQKPTAPDEEHPRLVVEDTDAIAVVVAAVRAYNQSS